MLKRVTTIRTLRTKTALVLNSTNAAFAVEQAFQRGLVIATETTLISLTTAKAIASMTKTEMASVMNLNSQDVPIRTHPTTTSLTPTTTVLVSMQAAWFQRLVTTIQRGM